MKKIILSVLSVAVLSACGYENVSKVSLSNYWDAKPVALDENEYNRIKITFGDDVKRVVSSPIAGLLEVQLSDGEVNYISQDLKVVINGELIRRKDNVNLTELSKKILSAERLVENALDNSDKTDSAVVKVQKESVSKPVIDKKEKFDNSELTAFTKSELSGDKDTSKQINPEYTNESLEEFKEKWKKRIADKRASIEPIQSVDQISVDNTDRRVSYNPPTKKVSAQAVTSPDKSPEDTNSFKNKNHMDVSLLSDEGSYILYKGTKLKKIGYDKEGNFVSAQEAKNQMKTLMDNIISKGDDWSMVFPSTASETKGEIVVFTDPTCPHCRQFHANMKQITDKGYDVRYLFYPRYLALGIDDPKAQTNLKIIKSIWCADNRIEESHKIYGTNTMSGFMCEDKPEIEKMFPAIEHYVLGLVAGLKSTPSVILPSGEMVAGFGNTLAALK